MWGAPFHAGGGVRGCGIRVRPGSSRWPRLDGCCQPRLHALVSGQVLAAAEVQAGQPTHHHARHGVSRQGRGNPLNPRAVAAGDRSMGAHRRQEHDPRARGLAALRRQGGPRPRQRHQHLPRHRAGGLGADGRLVLRMRLRPQDGRHQHADQGPGHRQMPGADRAGHLGRAKVTVLRGTTIGRGCVLGSHAVVKGVIPDYSIAVGAPRRRWSRTASSPGRHRRPNAPSWPRRWPTSNAKRPPGKARQGSRLRGSSGIFGFSGCGLDSGVDFSRNRSSSTGNGSISVEFFSAATSTTVCRSRS